MRTKSYIETLKVGEQYREVGQALIGYSGECASRRQWAGQAGGFWRVWAAVGNHDEEEHIRWYSVLDGPGGH